MLHLVPYGESRNFPLHEKESVELKNIMSYQKRLMKK